MTAPSDVTLSNLTGQYYLNKLLSDSSDPILALQGISWLTRKLISTLSLTLNLKQYTDDSGVDHIDITQVLTGGLKGDPEMRVVDGQWRESHNKIFGKLRAKCRWVELSEPITVAEGTSSSPEDESFLKSGWQDPAGTRHIESYSQNDESGWSAVMIWGFQEIEGERYYCRKIVVRSLKGDGGVERIRMVYDYYLGRE